MASSVAIPERQRGFLACDFKVCKLGKITIAPAVGAKPQIQRRIDSDMSSSVVIPEQQRGLKRKNAPDDFKNVSKLGKVTIAPAVGAKPQIQRRIDSDMASSVVIPEQQRGLKRKNAPGDFKNVRKLRKVTIAPAVGAKPQIQIQISQAKRSFDSQLFAEKNSKDEPLKSKSNEGVVINSPQKRVKTTVLTACSKFACVVTKKPKDPIVDIDAADIHDELAAVEYIEDMCMYYKLSEDDGRVDDYMCSQKDINQMMRACLVDWLISIHNTFQLTAESLYLAVNIVDRFLATTRIPRRVLQVVGISSLLIACKYEETVAPKVRDLSSFLDSHFVRGHVVLMEKEILRTLDWYLTVPTPYVFVVRYIKASIPADKMIENMSFFYTELGLTNYTAIIKYRPSLLSASAVYAARCTLIRTPFWTETLKHHSGYSEEQLVECAKLLVGYHLSNKLKAVFLKYSNLDRYAVALITPAKCLT